MLKQNKKKVHTDVAKPELKFSSQLRSDSRVCLVDAL